MDTGNLSHRIKRGQALSQCLSCWIRLCLKPLLQASCILSFSVHLPYAWACLGVFSFLAHKPTCETSGPATHQGLVPKTISGSLCSISHDSLIQS